VTGAEAEQLAVNGIINGSAYGLLGVGFGSILFVTGRFHFAYTFTYALSAYIAAEVGQSWGLPFWLALILGALVGAFFGALMELVVYRQLARRAGAYALLVIFVASLGLSIAGQNIISLIWISSASKQITGLTLKGINIGQITITNLGIYLVVTAWVLIIGLGVILRWTTLGRMIRAVRVNPDMSKAVGVTPETIYLAVFAVGSFLGGVAAVFDAAKTAATPDMGFNPLFYAFVVAFLAGASAPPVVVGLVALGIGLVESLSALFIATAYSQLVIFGILFVYCALRPIDLRQLTKGLVPVRR
jgi:branched-chain amino acid transport system permease protein